MFGTVSTTLATLRQTTIASSSRYILPPVQTFSQVRYRSALAPKRTKHRKAMKGMPISLPIGGSIRGTTLDKGTFGLRLLHSARLTAEQLTAAQNAIKRKIRAVKGAVTYMRVFPDIPVCVKGNEVRMGKGKGSFEFWACRVPIGRVVFEVGGGGIREEIAKQALKMAQDKLPVKTEFISSKTPARLGSISSSTLTPPPGSQPVPLLTVEVDAGNESPMGDVVLNSGEGRIEDVVKGLEGLRLPPTPSVEATI